MRRPDVDAAGVVVGDARLPLVAAEEQADEVGDPRRQRDVMEEDEKYIAAPLYATRLVGPFEQVFMKELKVLRRGVELADSSHQHFQSVVLPSFEAAAKEWGERFVDEFPDIPSGTSLRTRDPEAPTAASVVFDSTAPIDDLLVFVGCSAIDGPGGTTAIRYAPPLGHAAPEKLRSNL